MSCDAAASAIASATICSPASLIMLALGFSSGLPFLLVGNTLRLLAAR